MNWDDGTVDSYTPTRAGCDHPHVFAHAGMYTVTVTDDGGRSDSHTVLVVYDPDAGVVFGNGWLDKPGGAAFDVSGSYPSSTATVPQGAVTFSVTQPPLALRTNGHLDWVVISPDGKFAIKGTGELIPGRTVGFVMYGYTAPDRLRMVIRDAAAADNPVSGGFAGDVERVEVGRVPGAAAGPRHRVREVVEADRPTLMRRLAPAGARHR